MSLFYTHLSTEVKPIKLPFPISLLIALFLSAPAQAYDIPVLSGGYQYAIDRTHDDALPTGGWISLEFPISRSKRFVVEVSNAWKNERYDRLLDDDRVIQSTGSIGLKMCHSDKIIRPFLSLMLGVSYTQSRYFTRRYGTERISWMANWQRFWFKMIQPGVGIDVRVMEGIYIRVAGEHRRFFDQGSVKGWDDQVRVATGIVFSDV